MRIYLAPIHVRPHALKRMAELGIDMRQLKATLYNPDSQYPLDNPLGQVVVKRHRCGTLMKVYFRWNAVQTVVVTSVWAEACAAAEMEREASEQAVIELALSA